MEVRNRCFRLRHVWNIVSRMSHFREIILVITIDQPENTAVNKNDGIHLYLWPPVALSFLVTNTVATEVTFIAAACIWEKCGRVNEQTHNRDITKHCEVYTSRYGVDLMLRNNANNDYCKSGMFKRKVENARDQRDNFLVKKQPLYKLYELFENNLQWFCTIFNNYTIKLKLNLYFVF